MLAGRLMSFRRPSSAPISVFALMIDIDILASSGASAFMDFSVFIFNDFVSYPALDAVSMYTGRMLEGEKLYARRTMRSYIDFSLYSARLFSSAKAARIEDALDQSISCASGSDTSSTSSISSSDESTKGEVFSVFLCFIFWGEVEDFIVNELIFEMFLLDSVVDFVLAVDVELNVEVAVD